MVSPLRLPRASLRPVNLRLLCSVFSLFFLIGGILGTFLVSLFRTTFLPGPPPSCCSPRHPPSSSLRQKGVQGLDPLSEWHVAGTERSREEQNYDSLVSAPDSEDAVLFHKALVAETEAVPSAGSTPKVAFLFLTRGPLPLLPLWRRFFGNNSGKFSVVIHTAPSFKYKKGELPGIFFPGRVLSKPVRWGDISMVDAERRLIAHALRDPANARFVLLSESCLPLFNFSFTYDYLMNSPLSFLRMKVEKGTYGAGRWNKDFLPVVKRSEWRKGGQWVTLTRDAAKLVISDTTFYPEFKDHCNQSRGKPACYADEHYMQTMLPLLQSEDVLESRSLTWAYWSPIPGRGQHPETYRKRHIKPKLFQRLRGNPHCRWRDGEKSYCNLFARKFHADSVSALLNLTSVLGY